MTTTRSPGLIFPWLATALYATQHGSVRAAVSSGKFSGTLCRQRDGTRTNLVIAPLTP